MGKKSKKKGGNSSAKKTKQASGKGSSEEKKSNNTFSKRDSEQTSLYRIYKYCTEAVIQWGKATYKKSHHKVPKQDVTRSGKTSLSHVIFEILGSLASDGVLMPEPVLRDLKLAISYRKKVGRFYRSLTHVSDDDHARHEWLILQLELLARSFRDNFLAKKSAADDDDAVNRSEASKIGFEVLALSDDEDEDDSVTHDEVASIQTASRRVILTTPPTPEELEAEERLFAISLLLCEVDDTRRSLKRRWEAWARRSPQDDDEAGKNLLAVTACTEYALSASRKSVLQVSMEIEPFDDLDDIIAGIGQSLQRNKHDTPEFKEKDLVTLHSLEKRPDLNGRHGFVCNPVDNAANGGRLAVQLFPSNAYATPDRRQKLSIKPENLFLSDNTYERLCQIHSTFRSLDWSTVEVPSPPLARHLAPVSSAVQQAGIGLIMSCDKFENALRNQDFQSFLELTIKHVLPIWLSVAEYLPDVGAADAVLNAYIREFSISRRLKFPLAFALLIATDVSFACTREQGDDILERTKDVFVRILNGLFTSENYAPPMRLLEQSNKKPDALYSHFEVVRHLRQEFSLAGLFFPLVSGELLLSGLRMHFVCGSGLPYAFVETYTNVLHIYWLLRSEGFLGRIPKLERIIGMYRQQVFFRGGLAKKGQESYAKCQQLAHGVSAQAMAYIDGRGMQRIGPTPINQKALGRDGLHVSEISRLLDVLQWKSMPIVDKNACFDEIERVAREEYTRVFTSPLLEVSVKLSTLAATLGEAGMVQRARQSGSRMATTFNKLTCQMLPIDIVCFWAMCLGDDRSIVTGEKEECLSMFASYFSFVFGAAETIPPGEEPTLVFSPNDHSVDASLWGEKGVGVTGYSHI